MDKRERDLRRDDELRRFLPTLPYWPTRQQLTDALMGAGLEVLDRGWRYSAPTGSDPLDVRSYTRAVWVYEVRRPGVGTWASAESQEGPYDALATAALSWLNAYGHARQPQAQLEQKLAEAEATIAQLRLDLEAEEERRIGLVKQLEAAERSEGRLLDQLGKPGIVKVKWVGPDARGVTELQNSKGWCLGEIRRDGWEARVVVDGQVWSRIEVGESCARATLWLYVSSWAYRLGVMLEVE
jgi:hypothetical protein